MKDDIPQMAGHPVGDKAARKRFISRTLWLTVPATPLVVGALYHLVPPLGGVETLAERLALTMRWLFVAMLPYAAVCLTILVRRFFEGAHNPLAGGESETLLIHGRVLGNTLEQLIWLAFCLLALATLLEPAQMRLIPIACVFFVFARLVFWWATCARARSAARPASSLRSRSTCRCYCSSHGSSRARSSPSACNAEPAPVHIV